MLKSLVLALATMFLLAGCGDGTAAADPNVGGEYVIVHAADEDDNVTLRYGETVYELEEGVCVTLSAGHFLGLTVASDDESEVMCGSEEGESACAAGNYQIVAEGFFQFINDSYEMKEVDANFEVPENCVSLGELKVFED